MFHRTKEAKARKIAFESPALTLGVMVLSFSHSINTIFFNGPMELDKIPNHHKNVYVPIAHSP